MTSRVITILSIIAGATALAIAVDRIPLSYLVGGALLGAPLLLSLVVLRGERPL